MKTIFIASDHRGYSLKTSLIEYLNDNGFQVVDCGPDSSEQCDYPDYAHKLCKTLGAEDMGILICHTGIGMSMAANRHSNIRAALCKTEFDAQCSRQHNNANVLVLGSFYSSEEDSKKIFDVFHKTNAEAGRHQKRVEKI